MNGPPSFIKTWPSTAPVSAKASKPRFGWPPGSKDQAVKVAITGVTHERWQTVAGKVVGISEDVLG